MKARQASAAAQSAKHKSDDVSRKAAMTAFEEAVLAGGSSDDVFRRLQRQASVRATVEAHKSRLRKDGTRDEIVHLRKVAENASADLAVVAEKVCAANEIAHRMSKVGGR